MLEMSIPSCAHVLYEPVISRLMREIARLAGDHCNLPMESKRPLR